MHNMVGIVLSQIYMKLFGRALMIDDKTYNRILYWTRNGKSANIDNPKTFNEYVLAIKVKENGEALTNYTDKLLVREYVQNKIGQKYLVPLLGVWKSPQDIEFDSLPTQYILKTNHGSGWNYIVKDNRVVDRDKVISFFSKAIKSNYYYKSREKNYKNITPCIMAEELLIPNRKTGIIDVKLFCFYGKPQFYAITYRDYQGTHYGLFKQNSEAIPIENTYLRVEDQVVGADEIEELKVLAASLSSSFDFVRVDFYLSDSDIYFSELTFHSGGGIRPIKPKEIDLQLGKYFEGDNN